MELKATSMGKRLAQHPYHGVRMLTAGVEVSGDQHEYIIPFNQLLGVKCKRGVVWGELEFQLTDEQVVRLHGTEWSQTQRFWQHLMQRWQQWSEQMFTISLQVLTELQQDILAIVQKDCWLTADRISQLHTQIQRQFDALPLPLARYPERPDCYQLWEFCNLWLKSPESQRQLRNQQWQANILQRYHDFFSTVEQSPLNSAQQHAVINGEKSILVLAGAGSGKTSVLVARAGWLVMRKLAQPEQIMMLAFNRHAAEELHLRMQRQLSIDSPVTKTFHALALAIIHQATHKEPIITQLETDTEKRHALLLATWLEQCSQKKAAANGWRQCLVEDLGWDIDEGAFWESAELQSKIPYQLEKWLGLIHMHGGSQAQMIAEVAEAQRPLFAKRIKLMAPVVKAWRSALKEEGALDFSGLLQQACALIEKGRFLSPWKHILIDEFQDISPLRAKLITLLRQQNRHTEIFAVGDDWQSIYHFAGADIDLTTRFHEHFGTGAICHLDTTYRFDQQVGDCANHFIQQNPQQLAKVLNSTRKGNKKSITLLPESQLEALLDKMSGYVTPQESILILSRFNFGQPLIFDKAKTRWPNLKLEGMTIHASKGREADYVIICGLSESEDGFPADINTTIIEQVLLARQEEYPDAEERRLAYVAMTRAKQRVWLLYDVQNPSRFVADLKASGVKVSKKP